MKKFIISITTVAVVGLGSVFFSHSVQAETINELETKQSNVKNDREEVKENLSKAEAEIADVLYDLKEMNEEIEKVNKALKENKSMMTKTTEKIKESESEIEELEEEITELEETIEVRNELLKSRIASMQKAGGNVGFLEVLFGSKSFDEFISRTSAASKITNADADLIEQQERDKGKIDDQRDVYQAKLDEQTEQKVELEGMQDLISTQKEENKSSKKKLQKKEKELGTLKAELETKDSNLASIESQIRNDIESAQAPAQAVTASNSSSSSDHSSDGDLGTLSEKKPKETEEPKESKSAPGNKSAAVNAGYAHLGTPYVWAGKNPGGFDCSGFVSWAYDEAGYNIPSSTAGLSSTGQKVSYSDVQPGDLVFFDTYKTNGHVGIYVGNGNFIGAQNSTGLAVANMESGYWQQHFSGHVRRLP